MSIASSYKPKSLENSSDVEDLRQQVKVLIEENKNLTAQLEELIDVNNELTSSIEEYSKLHEQKFGSVDPALLQLLALKVDSLNQQSQRQKGSNGHTFQTNNLSNNQQRNTGYAVKSHSHTSSNEVQESVDFNIEQIFQVIKQLTNNIQNLQQEYQQQLQGLQIEFQKQKEHSQQIFKEMKLKFVNVNDLSKQLLLQMHSRDEVIDNLNREISIQRNKKSQIHKQMKISLTIEDLKHTLESKLEEKDQIIKSYEVLIIELRKKFGQFIV